MSVVTALSDAVLTARTITSDCPVRRDARGRSNGSSLGNQLGGNAIGGSSGEPSGGGNCADAGALTPAITINATTRRMKRANLRIRDSSMITGGSQPDACVLADSGEAKNLQPLNLGPID